MDTTTLVANRLLHIAVLTVIALILLGLTLHQATPYRLFIAIAPLLTWVLGKYYERAIILQAELVDEETLRELERTKAQILFRN